MQKGMDEKAIEEVEFRSGPSETGDFVSHKVAL